MKDLDELRERVAFATAETRNLSAEIEHFIQKATSILSEPDGGIDTLNVFALQASPVPVSIRSKAGMIANELRATLDALACILAARNGKRTDDTYFPISKSKEIFDNDGMKKMRRLSEADRATIANLRPYAGGHPQFFALHEADRKRKHQKLAACSAQQLSVIVGGRITAASVNMNNTWFEGIYVRDMKYFRGKSFSEVAIGSRTLIATGVPGRLPVKIEVDLTYEDPDALKGASVQKSLEMWGSLVLDTISAFD